VSEAVAVSGEANCRLFGSLISINSAKFRSTTKRCYMEMFLITFGLHGSMADLSSDWSIFDPRPARSSRSSSITTAWTGTMIGFLWTATISIHALVFQM